jgi:hypothetical protein
MSLYVKKYYFLSHIFHACAHARQKSTKSPVTGDFVEAAIIFHRPDALSDVQSAI